MKKAIIKYLNHIVSNKSFLMEKVLLKIKNIPEAKRIVRTWSMAVLGLICTGIPGVELYAQSPIIQNTEKFLESGKPDKAYQYILKEEGRNPEIRDPEFWLIKGDVLWTIYTSNDPAYRSLVEAPLEDAAVAYEKAISFSDDKELIKKVEQKARIVKATLIQSGNDNIQKNKLKSAFTDYKYANDFSSLFKEGDTTLLMNIAALAYQINDHHSAITYYRKALEEGSGNPGIFLHLAELYKKQKNQKELEMILDMAIERFPHNQNLVYKQVNYYLSLGDVERLVEILKIHIKNNPDDDQLFFIQGQVYESMDIFEESIHSYTKAVEVNPGNVDALYALGNLYLQDGISHKEMEENTSFRSAERYLLDALSLSPGNKDILTALEQLYSVTGQFDKYEKIRAKSKKIQ